MNENSIISFSILSKRSIFISFLLLIITVCLTDVLYSQATTSGTETISTNSFIDDQIDYDAQDSIRFDIVKQKVFLYGKAYIKYGDIELKAGFISFDFKTKTVQARPSIDSTGKKYDFPNFKESDQMFDAKSMDYNFETKKGLVIGSKTKQDEGYLHGDTVKSLSTNEYHIKKGKYTTCELDHPHYYFNISKAIVKPNDKIIAGPLSLYVQDVPTPLALPFGYFPNQKNKGKGIVIPTYDNSLRYGFGLVNGGYYIPFLDKNGQAIWDLQLLGTAYLEGSAGFKVLSRYKKIYKNSGNVDFNYQFNKDGHPDLLNETKSNNFSLRWNHRQDNKARPNSSFSANVNISSINNSRQNFNATGEEFLTNTFTSAIQYRKSIPNTPFSFNINGSHNQNTQTKIVNVTLPDMSWNMNRIKPFGSLTNGKLRNNGLAKEVSKIWLTWNSQLRNTLTAHDSILKFNNLPNLLNQTRNGIQHNFTTGTSFKILNQKVSLNPSLRFTERWYLQKLVKTFDNNTGEVVSDTLRGFSNWQRAHNYSVSANATTKLYGYYGFANFLQTYRKTKIRHVLTPSLSFSYNPSFDQRIFGFYGTNGTVGSYTPFDLGVFGAPSPSESGRIGLSLVNSLEMKINAKTDTGLVVKKYSILDNFSANGSYDIFADSLRFSNITLNARTTLFKMFSINANATLDPYAYDTIGGVVRKVDKSYYSQTKKLGRITSANLALNFNLNGDKFKKKIEKEQEKSTVDNPALDAIKNNPEGFIDFDIPWNTSFSYNINISRRYYLIYNSELDINELKDSATINQTIDFTGDVNLTKNWKIGIWMNVDITNKKLQYTAINLYRNLHCWEMSLNWVPFGPQQSYNFQLNVKSAMLKDLRIKRQRAWFDNQIQ